MYSHWLLGASHQHHKYPLFNGTDIRQNDLHVLPANTLYLLKDENCSVNSWLLCYCYVLVIFVYTEF